MYHDLPMNELPSYLHFVAPFSLPLSFIENSKSSCFSFYLSQLLFKPKALRSISGE